MPVIGKYWRCSLVFIFVYQAVSILVVNNSIPIPGENDENMHHINYNKKIKFTFLNINETEGASNNTHRIRNKFSLEKQPNLNSNFQLYRLASTDTTDTINATTGKETKVIYDVEHQPEFWGFWGQFVLPKSQLSYFGIDKLYVVHCSVLIERRQRMTEVIIKEFGPEWQENSFVSFVTALDGDNITLDEAFHLSGGPIDPDFWPSLIPPNGLIWASNGGIYKGALSVGAKHHIAYFDAFVHGYKHILIIEDDVILAPDFGKKTQEIIASLPTGWSNCFLACPWCNKIPSSCRYSNDNDKVCLQPDGSGSNGAVAYLVSFDGSRRLLRGLPIWTHADHQMNSVSRRDHNMLTFRSAEQIAWEDKADRKQTWNREATLN